MIKKLGRVGLGTGIKHIDHFTRCKQHWSRSTSCFSLLLFSLFHM